MSGTMAVPDGPNSNEYSLASSPPTGAQRRFALAVATLLTVAFALTMPLARVHLRPIEAFIPALQGVFSVADLITAVLLYSNFSIDRSRCLLILADGYLFAAFITTAFSLTFPGAFAPTGLFGAGLQSAAWLYMLWHFGFSLAVLLYSCAKAVEDRTQVPVGSIKSAIVSNVIFVFLLVCGMTWFVTNRQDWLPPIFSDRLHLTGLIIYITAACLLLSATALGLLWMRRRTVLDLWLIVVALAMIWELVVGITITGRYDFGFYAGRIYTLFVSIIVLILFLVETTKLDARLARANMKLRQERDSKMMTLAAMTSSISHEMRQPLMAVTMNASAALQYLKRSSPDIDAAREMLRSVAADIGRAGSVLDNIRDLFKESDAADHATIDLNEIVRGALTILGNDIKDRGVAVQTDLAPELPRAQGHRGQLEQVLLNLLNNALEAAADAPRGRPTLQISTELNSAAEIAVSVEDSGEGIDQLNAERLFDPFVTSKSKGMGLGLAIARLIVERHGGRIAASSSSALGGAMFAFTLPVPGTGPN
jgi:signal transduction histidine kinase